MFGRFAPPPSPILEVIGGRPESATHPVLTVYIMLLDREWLKQKEGESSLLNKMRTKQTA
jgi:hypothetical protein